MFFQTLEELHLQGLSAARADLVQISRSGDSRILRIVAYWLTAIVLCVVAVPAILNFALGASDRLLHPPAGSFYQVDGAKMHIYCAGTGAPTVILDAGLGDDFLQWRKVQPALSQLTRVCSYDRAGYGWSDPQAGPRDSVRIADQLHSLLQQAGISGPILLMGHSASGLHIREYATKYPEGVAGLVFVDASTPTQFDVLPAQLTAPDDLRWPKIETVLGIVRLRGRCGQHEWTGRGTVPSDSPEDAGWMRADDCELSVLNTTAREEEDFRASCREAGRTGPFPNLPILIFSEDPEHRPPGWEPARLFPVFAGTWNTLQEGLKQLSPRSRRIIARGSSHYVQVDRPELVIAEVGHMIRSIQGIEPQPAVYGTTVTE
jgi:pimeloyl-ACP methyl ester carboxylesterase